MVFEPSMAHIVALFSVALLLSLYFCAKIVGFNSVLSITKCGSLYTLPESPCPRRRSMPPRFTTAPIASTPHAPLVALGFWVRQLDVWAPIPARVQFTQPTHTTEPVHALLDLAVGILAGGEVVAQVHPTMRSDPVLAQAWGRAAFAEQSTMARVLDACPPLQVAQWRQAHAATLRWLGQVYSHAFAQDWLRLDVDLTALEASAAAEGSEKGYVPGKKTHRGGNWAGWWRLTTGKGFCRISFPGPR